MGNLEVFGFGFFTGFVFRFWIDIFFELFGERDKTFYRRDDES